MIPFFRTHSLTLGSPSHHPHCQSFGVQQLEVVIEKLILTEPPMSIITDLHYPTTPPFLTYPTTVSLLTLASKRSLKLDTSMRDTFSAKFPFDILMSDSGTAAYCCPLRCSGLPSAYGGNRLHPPEANLNFFFFYIGKIPSRSIRSSPGTQSGFADPLLD